jgi:hypothetical protein
MTTHDNVPYADPEPLSELIEECRCVEGECASHGVDLHAAHHVASGSPPAAIVIDDAARHAVDGFADYGG